MAFGYLGELKNINLDNLTNAEGFYEINDPNIVSSFNNYPDDSHILYKLIFQHDDLNKKYKIYTNIDNKITKDILDNIKNRHKAVYYHLSGSGQKVITGILEVRNFEDQKLSEESKKNIFCYQKFYRANDNVSFVRYYNGASWTEWAYVYTDNTEYLQIAEDIVISKTTDMLNRAFQYYAPPYDDTRLKAEVETKTDMDEFNKKLKKNNSEMGGTLTLRGGSGSRPNSNMLYVSKGPLIVDTDNKTNGDGSYIHAKIPSGHYQQLSRIYVDGSAVHLGIGHPTYSRVHINNSSRGASGQYPTNLFWNDPNNPDMEIQHLGRLQFLRLSGRWPMLNGSQWDLILDDLEEVYVKHFPHGGARSQGGYGVTAVGGFIWPVCSRESSTIRPSTFDAAYSRTNPNIDIDAGITISLQFNNTLNIWCSDGMEFEAFVR